jgi:hypothetical protein
MTAEFGSGEHRPLACWSRRLAETNLISHLNPRKITHRALRTPWHAVDLGEGGYTDAALANDIPEHGLRRGDVVKVGRPATPVFSALGDTIAVTAVPESALESLHKNEVLSVRPLTAAS